MSEQPERMDLHEFRASRNRKTATLLKEDHRDLKRFFALDSAAYRDATADGGLDERTKELLGLVASTVLRCNDCIAYHCDRCVQVGWRKSELLDALNVALVVGGSITIPHLRTVWEVVEQLYEEREAADRARQGAPKLAAAAKEVQAKVEEKEVEAKAMLGLPAGAQGRTARASPPPSAARRDSSRTTGAATASARGPTHGAQVGGSKVGAKAPPAVKANRASPKKSQGI